MKLAKIFTYASKLISVVFLVLAIMSVIVLGLRFNGYDVYILKSGSMSPTLCVGGLVIVDKNYAYEGIKRNDIIVFLAGDDRVTHRVLEVKAEGLETKGDANNVSDGVSTTADNYIGKVIFSNNSLGFFYEAVFAAENKMTSVVILISLFLLSHLFSAISDLIEKSHINDSSSVQSQ